MPKSQTELCVRALKKLLQIGAGQAPSAEDIATAQESLPPLVAELSTLEICSIDLSDDTDALDIDDELFQGLATLLAMDIGPDFGQPMATNAARQDAMNVLRRITSTLTTYRTQKSQYF